jgi:DNA-3-methyladenine glycosylase
MSAHPTPSKLSREFYTRRGVLTVARELLGQRLVVPSREGRRVAGIIVETEAYRGPADRASHAYGGRRTKRTDTMYRIGGTAYVYFVYGMHYQFNVVTGVEDVPHAILVRALEPVEGMDIMAHRRGVAGLHLTSGPGKLCAALGIDRALDGADLTGDRIWIERGERSVPPSAIARGPRIGIDYAGVWAARPWRFWIRRNPFVSGRQSAIAISRRSAELAGRRAARSSAVSRSGPSVASR